jgi:hypothetical protein
MPRSDHSGPPEASVRHHRRFGHATPCHVGRGMGSSAEDLLQCGESVKGSACSSVSSSDRSVEDVDTVRVLTDEIKRLYPMVACTAFDRREWYCVAASAHLRVAARSRGAEPHHGRTVPCAERDHPVGRDVHADGVGRAHRLLRRRGSTHGGQAAPRGLARDRPPRATALYTMSVRPSGSHGRRGQTSGTSLAVRTSTGRRTCGVCSVAAGRSRRCTTPSAIPLSSAPCSTGSEPLPIAWLAEGEDERLALRHAMWLLKQGFLRLVQEDGGALVPG